MKSLTKFFEEYLGKKAPALPPGVKSFLVLVAPWLIIISILMALPAVLLLLGINAFLPGLFYYQAIGSVNFTLVLLIETLALVFNLIALPGLFKKTVSGWTWVYYAVLAQTLASLFSANLAGGIIGLIISMYILFQVRSYYR
jgi:hypothetical protein